MLYLFLEARMNRRSGHIQTHPGLTVTHFGIPGREHKGTRDSMNNRSTFPAARKGSLLPPAPREDNQWLTMEIDRKLHCNLHTLDFNLFFFIIHCLFIINSFPEEGLFCSHHGQPLITG